jgi:hypothetical protein
MTRGMAVLAAAASALAQPAAASVYFTRPTARIDLASPTSFALDGGFAHQRWPQKAMPVDFRVNPANPGPAVVVLPGRDPQAELLKAVRRSFEHWDRTTTDHTFLRYRFRGTTATTGAFDGVNTVSFSEECPPFVLGLNRAYTFLVPAPVPGTDPLRGTWAYPNFPFTVVLEDGRTFVDPGPGDTFESDTDLCTGPDFAWSLTLHDGVSTPGTNDLESLAIHEAGHFSGLHHSLVMGSSMFSDVDPLEGRLGDDWVQTPVDDDANGIAQLYPKPGQHGDATIKGRVTVGSLFPGLPDPPPFVGPPLAPGSGAFAANVVALDEHGRVQASTLSNPDGSFEIRGLDKHGSYTLETVPFHGRYFGGLGHAVAAGPELSPLISFRSAPAPNVRPGQGAVALVVEDALPGRGDELGIGDVVPPTADIMIPGFIQDDPATPLAEVNFEFSPVVVEQGQQLGGAPTSIPGLRDGALFVVKIFVGTEAEAVSIDPIDGFVLDGPPVPLTFINAAGQPAGSGFGLNGRVQPGARLGLRNLTMTDADGNRFVLAGAFEVVREGSGPLQAPARASAFRHEMIRAGAVFVKQR